MAIAENGGVPVTGPIEIDPGPVEAAPPAAWIAVIAADGTLQEFDPTAKADGITVPTGCDLEPGKYRWNAAGARFEPILEKFGGTAALPPDQVRAIARGFMAIRDAKLVKLPPATTDWLDWYARTMDNQG